MSTVSITANYRFNARRIFQTLIITLKRWCVAYITWRMENIASAQLRAMSDRELEDIGITRSDIARAVTGARTQPAPQKPPEPESTLLPS